jgi:hypothetical protein
MLRRQGGWGSSGHRPLQADGREPQNSSRWGLSRRAGIDPSYPARWVLTSFDPSHPAENSFGRSIWTVAECTNRIVS